MAQEAIGPIELMVDQEFLFHLVIDMDSYPASFDIPIDRDRLRKYLRLKWSLFWLGPMLALGMVFGLGPGVKQIERRIEVASTESALPKLTDVVTLMIQSVGIGGAIGLTIGFVCYLLCSHWLAPRFAKHLHVSVEGPFLRIQQQFGSRSDRKLHFRSIVDYTTSQGLLMRWCGLHALQMSTTAGGMNSIIVIPGVIDCLKMRDALSEIDRLRENE